MRILLLSCFVLLSALIPSNVAVAEDIAQGVKVIIIDAGHGGAKYPGAHYRGVYEKDLNLQIALRLGALIEQNMPQVTVVYTRKSDTQLAETLVEDLQARADIANKAGGDLFISIHTNAARSTAAAGTETLIMGESTREQQANEDALFANNKEDLIDMSNEKTAAIVRAYIQNLQFTYGQYSEAMARLMQNSYQRDGRVSRGVKKQLLKVLYTTDMPGVLTEIGFLSNAQEFDYITSEKGQDEIARSLFRAVQNYNAYVCGSLLPQEATDSVAQPTLQPVATPPSVVEPTAKATVQVATAYAIQLLASPKTVALSSSQFKKYRGKVREYSSEGRFCYKYCVGPYDEQQTAQKRLREVRKLFPDAFVVQVEGDKIVK